MELEFGLGRSGRSLSIQIEKAPIQFLNIVMEYPETEYRDPKIEIYRDNCEGNWYATRWFSNQKEITDFLWCLNQDEHEINIEKWGAGYGDEPPEPGDWNWREHLKLEEGNQ